MKTIFNAKIPVSILKEDKKFIAYSPALDLSTSGKNYEEAQKRFKEVVQIFFEELIEMGTLKEVLSDLGWKKIKQQWNPPVSIANELFPVSIPLKQ